MGGGRDPVRECARPLLPDLTDATSVLSVSDMLDIELRGLSLALVPGILDLRARNDREDSLVSDLLKEGDA